MSNPLSSNDKKIAASTSLVKTGRKRDPFPHHLMSEFQCFIGHEYFPNYLFLVFSIKAIRQSFLARTVPNESEVLVALGERRGEDDLLELSRFIQSRFIPLLDSRTFIPNVHYVPVGMYKVTDSLIFDSIRILRVELRRCLQWYTDSASDQPLSNSAARATRTKRMKPNPKQGKKSEAIAVKYSKQQTDILNGWMINHRVSYSYDTGTRQTIPFQNDAN